MRRALVLCILLLMLIPMTSAAKIWVIKPNGTGDFFDIQAAVDTTVVANWDTLELTNGDFKGPGNRRVTFKGKALTIRSQSGDRDSCVIDCEGFGPAFHFRKGDGSNQTIESITITNGFATAGGGICCDSLCAPTIRDCMIFANQADIGGGIACFYLGNPRVIDCRIESNFAGRGAGVYTWLSLPTFEKCVIYMNQAILGPDEGGGIYSDSLSVSHYDSCWIIENFAGKYGGGIYSTGGSHDTLAGCFINMNEADWNGGAAYCTWSHPYFSECTLNENTAGMSGFGGYGGALCALYEPHPAFLDCEFRFNQATMDGGAISCWRVSPRFTDCLIDSNSALGYALGTAGGGAYCEYHSDPVFTRTTITHNLASVGAGVLCFDNSSATLTGCRIARNEAEWYGGGICCALTSEAALTDCDILANEATADYGGGVALISSDATFMRCTIDSNTTGLYGGGVALRFCSPQFDSCSISANAADSMAGGVHCAGVGSYAAFRQCVIDDNEADMGGGIYCYGASPLVQESSISLNDAFIQGGGVNCDTLSSPTFTACALDSNTALDGGGIMCRYGSPAFEKCMIRGNDAAYSGGGAFCSHGSASRFTNCVVSGNSAGLYAGGLMSMDAADTVLHCTFSHNRSVDEPAGVLFFVVTSIMKNSVVAFSQGTGMMFGSAAASTVEYCDFFGNSTEDIGFQFGNPANGPPGIGVLSGINANGDSCDTYRNIFADPAFADTALGDYHLTDLSACISAGRLGTGVTDDIEGSPRPDPPDSPPDMGAYESGEGTSSVTREDCAPASTPALVSVENRPNPFGTTTEIKYALPQACRVTVEILDVRGRRLACPVNETRGAGRHRARFDAEGLSSGIYFLRLTAGDEAVVRKIVVLR